MNRDRLWAWQHRFAPYLFLLPFFVLFCTFTLFPMQRSLVLSLYKSAGPDIRRFVGLENYRFLIFRDKLFWLATINTAVYAVAFLCTQIPLSLGLALLLNSRLVHARTAFRFSFFSTHLVGQVFVAVVFFQLFSPRGGLINRALSMLARRAVEVQWLSDPNLVLPAVLIAGLWLSVGFGMVYFLAALQAAPPELYESAQIDGAGAWARFWHVTLPAIKPVLSLLIIVGVIGAFQLFELPYVLLQGPGPGYRAMTIVMYQFSAGFQSGDLGYASAIGWVLVAILFAVSMLQIRLLGAAEGVE